MIKFTEKPNLPQNKVESLICGGLNSTLIDYLLSRGIEIFYTKENHFVDKAVSKHCDISALYLGDGKAVIDNGQAELIETLTAKGFSIFRSDKSVKGSYPHDIILNHAIAGEWIIGKSRCFDRSVTNNLNTYKIIDTKQGYAKCSVLVVDENSIITDDRSIAENSRKFGLNCLLISKGDICLCGHDYGFIGGASGKLSADEIIFFGDITKHRDFTKIKRFLDDRGINIISFDFELTDFGGIIPLTESSF